MYRIEDDQVLQIVERHSIAVQEDEVPGDDAADHVRDSAAPHVVRESILPYRIVGLRVDHAVDVDYLDRRRVVRDGSGLPRGYDEPLREVVARPDASRAIPGV